MLLHRQEFRRLFQRPAQEEDEGNDETADEKRNSPLGEFDPPEEGNGIAGHGLIQRISDDRGDEDRDLLAGGLERSIEAPVAGSRDLGKVDRDAAEFDAGGEALQQAADQHDDRRGNADAGIGRTDRDRYRADRHDRQGDDQTLAAADPIDIGAKHDGADGAHQRAQPENAESVEQRGGLVFRWKEGFRNVRRIKAEQEEIELFEEIAAGRPENGANSRLELRRRRTRR